MSTNRRELLGLAGALLAGMAGCTTGEQNDAGNGNQTKANGTTSDPVATFAESDLDRVEEPDVSEEKLAMLTTGINGLAADLLVELAGEDSTNLFVSPASISLALAMAFAGARGQTEAEMSETLHYPDEPHPAFNAFDRSLDAVPDSAGEDEQLTLSIANRMWGHAGFPFKEDFLDTLSEHYGAGVQRLDFKENPEGARETINGWVADQTEDKIPELLPKDSLKLPGDDFVVTVLTNAIYMLADWKYVFDEENTEQHTFTTIDGDETDAELMYQEFEVPYANVDGTQIVDLPYVGERLSMSVILPPDGEFEDTRDGLTGDRLDELIGATSNREGELWLPHFEFSTDFKLSQTLEALGMPSAFDPSVADFNDMYIREESSLDPDQEVAIDEVYHEAFVAVDEEGTEAAAATAVVGGAITTSLGPDQGPFQMMVDRPFLFAIRDRETDTVLFFGQVGDVADIQS